MIDRHLLRYFLAVVDTGAFSRAAALCRVSQPTVSSGIARLEQITGQLLFNRTNRRVELSAAGARLVAHARKIEAEFIEAQRSLADVSSAQLVRIGLSSTVAPAMTEQLVAGVLDAGKTRLEIVERRSSELTSLLERGRVDLIVGPQEVHKGRRYIPLFSEPYLLVMHQRHRLAEHEQIRCEQLIDEPMLVRRQCEALPLVSQFFTARGIRPFIAARSASEERIAVYIRAGLGVTVMPGSLAGPDIIARPLVGFELRRTLSVAFDPASEARLNLNGTLQQLIEFGEKFGLRSNYP